MSFLAPLFLLGALAVSLPIAFHLIRRTTRERTPFSSLMFLQASPPRLTRRSRLEHILLLLLRCSIICLLALGFSRPFFKKAVDAPSPNDGRKIVVLLDSSASMRRADLWNDGRRQAEAIVSATSPTDQLALFTFDRQLTPLVSFEQWMNVPPVDRTALAIHKLRESSPGWAATYLGNALISAAEILADTAGKSFPGRKQIVVISDLQEGSRLEQLQGYEWPKGIEVSFEPLKPRSSNNAGLQLVTSGDDAEATTKPTVRVRIQNAPGSKRDQFQIGWANADGHFLGKPLDTYVPPGQNRILSLAAPGTGLPSLEKVPSPNLALADRIILKGDDQDFDNTAYVLPPKQTRLTVLYFGADSENDPRGALYFVKRAFHDTQQQVIQVIAPSQDQLISPDQFEAAALFIVTSGLSDDHTRLLREQIANGKTLLVSLSSPSLAPVLSRLLGLDRLAIEEARVKNYALLADIDFTHPLLAPFADPRFSDFSKIHFWKYRRIDPASIPGARVLANFEGGDPAILEMTLGKGRVLLFASGWRPDESQLALATKFVPLLYSLLEQSGGASSRPSQFFVGDLIPLEAIAGPLQKPLKIRTPDGLELNIAPGQTNFSQTLIPGIYDVVSAPSPKRFAVNLDPAESRTAPLPTDELERLGVPVLIRSLPGAQETQRKTRVQNSELENRQKVWRILLLICLAALLIETWFAGRSARRASLNPQH